MMLATNIAAHWNLRPVPGRREWRGDCPACSYRGTLALAERNGRPLLHCFNCNDNDGLANLLRGAGVMPVAPDPTREAECRAKRQRTHDAMLRLWASGEPVHGTPAQLYLEGRNIGHLAASPALRFRGDTPHPSGAHLPAMIALAVDVRGNPIGVHRHYVTRDGRKAAMEPAKATLGTVEGGCVRIGPYAPEIAIAEGVETAGAASVLLGLPCWAAVTCGNLKRRLALPSVVESVIIAADHDAPGIEAANAAARRWQAEGRAVRIALPDRLGEDFADVLMRREGGAV